MKYETDDTDEISIKYKHGSLKAKLKKKKKNFDDDDDDDDYDDDDDDDDIVFLNKLPLYQCYRLRGKNKKDDLYFKKKVYHLRDRIR